MLFFKFILKLFKAAIKEILHFPKDVNLWLKTIDEASKTEVLDLMLKFRESNSII